MGREARVWKKLLAFAALIEIPVKYTKVKKGTSAMFYWQGPDSYIEMCIAESAPKRDAVCLTLMHELGHALDWIRKGRPKKVPSELYTPDKDKTKEQRFLLWKLEREAIKNAAEIYHLLHLDIPRYKMETERMCDLWMYSYFYRKGRYAPWPEREKKWKKFKQYNKKRFP